MAALCVCTILGADRRDAMEKVGERPLLFLAASGRRRRKFGHKHDGRGDVGAHAEGHVPTAQHRHRLPVDRRVARFDAHDMCRGGFWYRPTGFVLYQHARRNPAPLRFARLREGPRYALRGTVRMINTSPYLTGTPTHFRGGSSASSPSAASGTSPSGSYAPSCVIKSPVAVRQLYLPGPMGWPSLAKVPT